MLGTKSINQISTVLTPKEKKKQIERLLRFKLILSVVITNLLMYFIMDYNQQSPTSTLPSISPEPYYSPLELSLEVSFPIDKNKSKIPISIYNQEKKQIIKKGLLHSEVKSLDNNQFKYVVEIHQDDLKTIILNQEQPLFAYPYGNYDLVTDKKKPKDNYEISF